MLHVKVRHGVFETNSSSTHAISLDSAPTYNDTLHVDESGCVEIACDINYGWEWESYSTAESKADYIAASILQAMRVELGGSITDQDDVGEGVRTFFDTIKAHTGANRVIITRLKPETKFGDISGVDHQSEHLWKEVTQDQGTCKGFLFSTNSVLFTGNDNDYHSLPDHATIR